MADDSVGSGARGGSRLVRGDSNSQRTMTVQISETSPQITGREFTGDDTGGIVEVEAPVTISGGVAGSFEAAQESLRQARAREAARQESLRQGRETQKVSTETRNLQREVLAKLNQRLNDRSLSRQERLELRQAAQAQVGALASLQKAANERIRSGGSAQTIQIEEGVPTMSSIISPSIVKEGKFGDEFRAKQASDFFQTFQTHPLIRDTVLKKKESFSSRASLIEDTGIMVYTESEAEKIKHPSSERPFFVIPDETTQEERNVIGDILRGTPIIKDQFGRETTSQFDLNKANLLISQETVEDVLAFNKAVGIESQKFKEDPLSFEGVAGFREVTTPEGTTFSLGEEYFKTLPEYKDLTSRFDEKGFLKQSEFKDALQEARDFRGSAAKTGTAKDKFRNVELALGEASLFVPQQIVKFGEFAASIPATMAFGGIIDPEKGAPKKNALGLVEVKARPDSILGRLSNVPSAPSTSDFRFTNPIATRSEFIPHLKDLTKRPAAVLQVTQAGVFIGTAVKGIGQTFTSFKGAGATKTGATIETGKEIVSAFSPIKIQSGIVGTGFETKTAVTKFNQGSDGFIKLNVVNKPTPGLTSQFKVITPKDKIIRSTILGKNVGTGAQTKLPGVIKESTIRGSERVFVSGAVRAGTPSLTGFNIPTFTTVTPVAFKLTPGADGGSTTTFKRSVVIDTKVPVQVDKFGFEVFPQTTTLSQTGRVVTTAPIQQGDRLFSTEETFATTKGGLQKTTFGKFEVEVTNLKPGQEKLISTSTSVSKPGDPIQIPDDTPFFKLGDTLFTKGVVFPSTSTSIIKIEGGGTEVLKGASKTFIPDIKLGGSGGVSSSGGGGGTSVSGVGGGGQNVFGSLFGPTPTFRFDPITGTTSGVGLVPPSGVGFGGLTSLSASTVATTPLFAPASTSFLGVGLLGSSALASQSLTTQGLSLSTTPVVTTTPVSVTIPTVITTPTATTTTATKTTTTQVTAPITTTVTTPITTITPITTTTTPIIPIITPPILESGSRRLKRKVKQRTTLKQGFHPEIKEKGKWKRIVQKARTRKDALALAGNVVDNTTAVQLRLIKARKKVKPSTSSRRININKFRDYSFRAGKRTPLPNQGLIENKAHRIDTRGEKQQLSAAKYLKGKKFKAIARPRKKAQPKRKSNFLFGGGFGGKSQRLI